MLLAASLLASLGLAEGATRVLRPDLAYAAQSGFVSHRYRIHANPRSAVARKRHPDTGIEHAVIHNALGLRQHREIPWQKPPGALRIGVFGDSFTENLRLPAEFSFSEPLDHLLNATGGRYEVLNFGTDGYGTDQVYLQVRDEGRGLDLDHALYLYFENDLRDIMADGLFELDAPGESSPDLEASLALFRQLVLAMRAEAESSSARFTAVLVPSPTPVHNARIAELLRGEGVEVRDLVSSLWLGEAAPGAEQAAVLRRRYLGLEDARAPLERGG